MPLWRRPNNNLARIDARHPYTIVSQPAIVPAPPPIMPPPPPAIAPARVGPSSQGLGVDQPADCGEPRASKSAVSRVSISAAYGVRGRLTEVLSGACDSGSAPGGLIFAYAHVHPDPIYRRLSCAIYTLVTTTTRRTLFPITSHRNGLLELKNLRALHLITEIRLSEFVWRHFRD